MSKALAAEKDREGPIYERLISEGVELKRQKELLAEQHAKQESDSVIGVPQIDKQSAALVKSKRDAAAAVSTTRNLGQGHAYGYGRDLASSPSCTICEVVGRPGRPGPAV